MCVRIFVSIEFSSKSVEIMGVPETDKMRLCKVAYYEVCLQLFIQYEHPYCIIVFYAGSQHFFRSCQHTDSE